MKVIHTIIVLLIASACATIDDEMSRTVSTYGHRAHVRLHNEWMITGELLLQQPEHVWVVSLTHRVVTVPLRDIHSVEVLDTKVSAYFTPTVMMVGAPWVLIGVIGTSFTGDAEYLPIGLAVGGVLTLLPTALNEAGLADPDFTANDIALGEISQYLRYPFREISDTVTRQILATYGQATPDTLRIPIPTIGE